MAFAKINTIALATLLLAGCSSNPLEGYFSETEQSAVTSTTQPQAIYTPDNKRDLCVSPMGQMLDCSLLQNTGGDNYEDLQLAPIANTHPLVSSNNTVLIGEYVEQMATNMLESLNVPVETAVVGVASFVEFTDDLVSVNPLGNLLAENFIFELQQNGIPVVDYKIAQNVMVLANGDYVFSRNREQLNMDVMSHVLTGSIIYNKQGLVVNARVVDLESKRVVSASKKVIPYFVLDSIIPASEKHAIIGSY